MTTDQQPTAAVRSTCPRRAYGTNTSNPSLAPTVPIIGLGCSSFSSFFKPSTSFNSDSNHPSDPSDELQEKERDGEQSEQLTRDNIDKDHPQVQKWIAAIHHAILDCGINLLDTAPWYGHGVSEIVVGYALEDIITFDDNEKPSEDEEQDNAKKRKMPRSQLIINTKIGRYDSEPSKQFDFSYCRTLKSVQLSLEHLKCKYIDVIQLHDPEFSPSIDLLVEETIPALIEAKDKFGWSKAIGITGYPLEVQREVLVRSSAKHAGAESFKFDQALAYCHCNLHDMSLFIAPPPAPTAYPPSTVSTVGTLSMNDSEMTRIISNVGVSESSLDDGGGGNVSSSTAPSSAPPGVAIPPVVDEEELDPSTSFADYCRSQDIALMAAAPLSMGLLTRAGPPDWHPASEALVSASRNAAFICSEEYGVDIASLAILFALSQVEIPCTLLGMKSIEEVDRAMELVGRFVGLDATLTTEEVLQRVLTSEEKEALVNVMDPEFGPFSDVWQTGEFQWNGIEEANKLWDQVEGGKEEADERQRKRE